MKEVFQYKVLLFQVRCHTQLSHDMSRVAVTVVLSDLERFMPNSTVLQKMLHVLQGPMCVPQPMIEQTHDAQRLKVIFSELTSCKDDAQQRSWMLHEDEDTIVEYITELTNILVGARLFASFCFAEEFVLSSISFDFSVARRWQHLSSRDIHRSVRRSPCTDTVLSDGSSLEHQATSSASTGRALQPGKVHHQHLPLLGSSYGACQRHEVEPEKHSQTQLLGSSAYHDLLHGGTHAHHSFGCAIFDFYYYSFYFCLVIDSISKFCAASSSYRASRSGFH